MAEDQDQSKTIRHKAIELLARREHSYFELSRKLMARYAEESLIDQLLCDLQQEGLLSDSRFAECFVRSRYNKGHGPYRIRMELQERRVDEAIINDYLRSDEWDWFDLAIKVRRKRFGDEPEMDVKQRAKQQRFLQYRGFSTEQINAAMRHQE